MCGENARDQWPAMVILMALADIKRNLLRRTGLLAPLAISCPLLR
jgi:hypothetical protein